MTKISKLLAIAAAAAVIGGAGLAVAQTGGPGYGPGYGMMGYGPPGGGPGGYGPMGYGPGFMRGGGGGYGMMGGWGGPASFSNPAARLDALKTELGIRPDQKTAWDAYTKAVQDVAQQMQAINGSIDFDKLRAMNWSDHQAYMAKIFDQRAAAFQSVQAAGSKLMAVLDDTQKSKLLSPGGTSAPGGAAWYGCPGGAGPGYGMMGWSGGGPGWMMGWGPGGGR